MCRDIIFLARLVVLVSQNTVQSRSTVREVILFIYTGQIDLVY
tara:strand:- start:176 stop:304 length:129 start_codon:yes stop_codon:yes gene_type:complete